MRPIPSEHPTRNRRAGERREPYECFRQTCSHACMLETADALKGDWEFNEKVLLFAIIAALMVALFVAPWWILKHE